MEPIPKSNHFYANKIVRLYLIAVEEVIGKNGLNTALNLAKLSHLIDNYPPDNVEQEFDFADFSTINLALEEIYGPKGGRLLSLRAGKVYFNYALDAFGEKAGLLSPEFSSLPTLEKLRKGLPLIAAASNSLSDQNVTVEERETDFLYTIGACPACWGRSGEEKPICAMPTGFLHGCVNFLMDGKEFSMHEDKCAAVGDEFCQYVIKKPVEG
ncbi:MAG: 4-vinyl reductase [Anaerolineales bacterium]|nr:4-vinyl reductase [Anaerolineales bacterium]